MKKIVLSFSFGIMSLVMYAQTEVKIKSDKIKIKGDTKEVKATKPATVATAVKDEHEGHAHAAKTVTAATPVKDEHAGHAHAAKPAVSTDAKGVEAIAFNKELHDFGKIPQGKPVTYVFEVKNTSAAPVKIINVQAACGCTTPEWDKENAIAPGATSKITVGYNAVAEGTFTKPVTITYGDGITKVINITGEVWKTPAESAPANTGINAIKN